MSDNLDAPPDATSVAQLAEAIVAALERRGFNEAPCSTDLRNPLGDLIHLRGPDVSNLVSQINDLWDPGVGARSDLTNVYLFSFSPAIQHDMREGRSAKEAFGMDRDMDPEAEAAYEAIKTAAQRPAPGVAAGNGGARSGSGGGGGRTEQKTFIAADIGERLPEWFSDQLTRNYLCPGCKDPAGVFNDNRGNDKGLPTFKCANKDCKGSKNGKYAWGAYDPEENTERSRSGSARTR